MYSVRRKQKKIKIAQKILKNNMGKGEGEKNRKHSKNVIIRLQQNDHPPTLVLGPREGYLLGRFGRGSVI